jgi:hypothetical protein
MDKFKKGFLFVVGVISIVIEETLKTAEEASKSVRSSTRPIKDVKSNETI